MRRLRLAPYQAGLWLTAHIDGRCQLCRAAPRRQHIGLSWRARLSTEVCLLCALCHKHLFWLPKPFHIDIAAEQALTIQPATYYDYPIRQAIAAFKHHEDLTKLPLLIHVLRQLPRPKGCHAGNSIIVPMPTTQKRLTKRGFDPVTILSVYLSKHWQIPLWHGVQRIDNTISQQGLSRSERLTNLNNAFMLTTPPPAKRVLLFDDVATTGASLQALANSFYPAPSNTLSVNSQPARYHISAYALAHGSHHLS